MAPQFPRNKKNKTLALQRRLAKFSGLSIEQLEDRIAPALFNVQGAVTPGAANANYGSLATGDFNGDGKTDVVMTNYGTGAPGTNLSGKTISVMLGNGNGTFGGANNITVGNDRYVSFVAVGDLNGDSKQDLAVVSNAENSTGWLNIYLGNGSGGFTALAPISTGSSNASWVGIAQMTNGDTNADIVVCGYGNSDQGQTTVFGNNITVFQGDGTGAVSLINTVANGLAFIPTALALADFNGDGSVDIAAAVPGVPADSTADQPNGFIQMFTGNGTGGFVVGNSFSSGGPLPISIQVANLNGDALPDLVVANAGNPDANSLYLNFGANSSVGVLVNTGGMNFNANTLTSGIGVSGSRSVFAVTVADFDGDNKQDIAAIVYGHPLTGANARVLLYKGDGNGGFTGEADSPYNTVATGGQYLAAAPIDGNTTPDIIYCTDGGKYGVLLNTSTANISTTTAVVSSGSPSAPGQSVTFTATVTPASGTASGGTVTFFDNGVQIGSPVTLTNQQAAITISTLTAGSHSITATYSGGTGFAGSTSPAITHLVSAGTASTFTITGVPTNPTAGAQFTVTVTARDQSGNIATGYRGIVHFTSSDAQGLLPGDYTFTAADNGVHTFTITLKTAGSQSFTVTDTVTATITATQSSINVIAAAASTFQVAGPPNTTAGVAQNFTVTARDAFGNIATGYTGTVSLTSNDAQATLPANYTFTAADNGVHSFSATLKTAGSRSFTATDTVTGSIAGSTTTTVNAAAASNFLVAGPSGASAGVAQNYTLTARDAFGNTATGYRGTVHFTSSDGLATLPGDYTFTAADNGVHTFPITLATSGSQSFTATDTTTASITGSANVTVSAAAATFVISGPTSVTAGIGQTFTVTARDAFGNTATGYRGTIQFSSTDVLAGLPTNYTFTAADNGVHTFTITLKTSGSQSVTATDTVTGSIAGNTSSTVNAAAASVFTLTGFPTSTTAGAGQTFTITARDQFGNIATGYRGTVHFTSTDAQATLPTDYTFTAGDNGSHTFTATLKTAGSRSLTATDTVTGSINASTNTTVNAAGASNFLVSGPSSMAAGVGQSFTVTARDAFGNTATSYTGTVHFTSTDGQAVLPADYTFTPADSGVRSFTVTLKTAGSRSVTATDTTIGSITGSATINVTPGAATTFVVSGPSTTTAGVAQNYTVTARDAFGNTATGYTGTVSFTSSDAQAVLPASYTFTAGDNGVHIFSITLRTAGSQSFAATDTTTGTITGGATVTVNAAVASVLQFAGPTSTTEGVAQNFTITARDAFGNVATGYTGTIHFVSNDNLATLPSDYTFTAGDNGTHTFSVTLRTVGNQTVIATDTTTGTITGSTNVTVNASPPPPPAPMPYAVGTSPGTVATVKMYNADNTLRFAVQPFGAAYRKGVRVAVGDVTGDGVLDVVAASNGGIRAKVRVIDGATGNILVTSLIPVSSYMGKVSVAVGDVNGDGIDDIAVGTNELGSRIRVYNGGNFTKLTGFRAGPSAGFLGNTSVAFGDMTGDGRADLVVTSRYTGRSRVIGYNGSSLAPGLVPATTFTKFALAGKYVSGLYLALGDVNADDCADLIIGTVGNRPPSVITFSGQSLVSSNTQTTIANFTPVGSSSKNGVRVGVRDIDGDGILDILTSSGEMVSAFRGGSGLPASGLPTTLFSFDPDPAINGGVWIG